MKTKNCKLCDSSWHSAWQCPLREKKYSFKPQKALRWQSPKTRDKEDAAKEEWFAANPPDGAGLWTCYLQISPHCPILLNRDTVVQEHVKSKASAPELKYDISNRKPTCAACNKAKGGRKLEDIEEYHGNYN